MTDRLYYTDPYSREFDASIAHIDGRDGRTLVTLDRTGFYPTSGGQPFDTGTLGGLRVVDVLDQEDGSVLHVVEDRAGTEAGRSGTEHAPPLRVGETVHGVVDWPRRFDHMQQHTGQHVLSAAFDRLFGVRTVSFHLGAAVSTIDLARELVPSDIATAESLTNRIVWENRPVTIRFADAEDAVKLPLRKPAPRSGTLRLIDVEDFDLSACGGTHVARTGAIGMIAIGSWERFKGGQRIEFVCGGRALGMFRSLRDTASEAMRLLSVSAEALPGAIERLQAAAKDQRRAVVGQQGELARYRAQELAASAEPTDRGRLVVRAVDGDATALKSLASAIIASPGYAVVLVTTSTPALVVVARSADVNVPADQVLGMLTARFGGRGGGKPDLAQGGGLSGPTEGILETARAAFLS